jgi:hypothetical protein
MQHAYTPDAHMHLVLVYKQKIQAVRKHAETLARLCSVLKCSITAAMKQTTISVQIP